MTSPGSLFQTFCLIALLAVGISPNAITVLTSETHFILPPAPLSLWASWCSRVSASRRQSTVPYTTAKYKLSKPSKQKLCFYNLVFHLPEGR